MGSRYDLLVILLPLCLDKGWKVPGTFLGSSSIRTLRGDPGAQGCRALSRASLCAAVCLLSIRCSFQVALVRTEGKGHAEEFPFLFSTEESQADAEWAVSQDLESRKQPIPDRPNLFSYAWPPSLSLQT